MEIPLFTINTDKNEMHYNTLKCTYRRQVICWESLDALRIPKSSLLHEIGIRI